MAEATNTSAHPSPLSKSDVSLGLGFVSPVLERREGESLVLLKSPRKSAPPGSHLLTLVV